MRIFLFAISFSALSLGGGSTGSDCHEVRAAFDIGSGATKMKVAKVNTCLQKIEEILLEADEPVKYKESLQNSSDNKLDEDIQDRGVKALAKLKSQAEQYRPESYLAVATSAFRTASNGQAFAEKMSDATGVQVRVIDQEAEARLGFAAATRIASGDMKNLVVWDIGGGSMQIISYTGESKFSIYQGKMASASFKSHIIKKIKNQDTKKTESPNPIGAKDAKAALEEAKEFAKLTVPAEIKKRIKSGAQIVGIGGVHSQSIMGQLARDGRNIGHSYSLKDLDKAIDKSILMGDEQIGGAYASTEASNLILVKGFMKELEIDEVRTGRINLADGLLLGGTL